MTKSKTPKKKPPKYKVEKNTDKQTVEQICQMLNGSLDKNDTSPKDVVQVVGTVIDSLNKCEKRLNLIKAAFEV